MVGGGAHTIPTYRALLKELAREYEILLFSEFHIDAQDYVPEYVILSTSKIKNRRWRELRFGLMVLKECLKNRIQIIHSHSTYPSGIVSVIVGNILRLPVLVSLDAAEASEVKDIGFGDLKHTKRKRVNQWVMNRATALTALTEFQKREVQSNLSVKKEIRVIYRGVDLSVHFHKPKGMANNKTVRFLNVAYIHPVKDHDTLLKAFKTISQQIEATLTIVGKDYENGRLQREAKKLGIEHLVNFVGFVPHTTVQTYFNDADILLHTSRYESQALVVVEAMASGVLVCGTHVGLMADLAGRCCVTAPIQDDTELAKQVVDLMHDEKKQNELRAAGLRWTQTHSLTWTAQQYLILYDQLLDNSYPQKNA